MLKKVLESRQEIGPKAEEREEKTEGADYQESR